MKKHFHTIVVIVLSLAGFTQCKEPGASSETSKVVKNTPLRKLEEQLMVEILNLAKKDDFRQFVLDECIKQKHGDYDVRVTDIIAAYRDKEEYKAAMANLKILIERIKLLVGDKELIVFYPRAETIEDQMLDSKIARTTDAVMNEPLGVFQVQDGEDNGGRVNDMPEGTVDAYRAYINGTWQWVQYIDEQMAWETDVYVIGYEENVSPENQVQTGLRVNGEAEYGGKIQVTNLNGIEHWTNGKLEFRCVIVGASGSPAQNRPFGKFKRKNFKDNQWFDFNFFIGNWNVATYGNWMSECWIEEDGGQSVSTTISIPANNGFPAFSYTFPPKDNDDQLGTFTVQFTDAKSTVYQLMYANVMRK